MSTANNNNNNINTMDINPVDEKDIESDSSFDLINESQKKQKSIGVLRTEIYVQQYNTVYHKLLIYFGIFLVAYAFGLDSTVRSVNLAYAQSSYSQHSLLSTVTCIQAVIAAAAQIAFARISDVFGRITLFICALVFYAMGTIIESQATNVQKFAAGAVFYSLGLTTLQLLLEIIASDFSQLNYRVVASFVIASPFIINTWISGNVEAHFGANNWSWGIGMWAFIIPLASIPLFGCLVHMNLKSRKLQEYKLISIKQKELINKLSYKKYLIEKFFWELDVIGLLLTISTFGLILVPFTLAGGIHSQWEKAHIIVPLVIGFVISLPLFLIWEIKFAKVPLLPKHLIKDRGVYSAIIMAVLINFIWYQQGDYMYTVLVVGNNESVKSATRIVQLYSFVSVITGFIVGLVISRVRRLKPFVLFGTCMWLLSFGLLIKYRGGDSVSHSGIIGSLCLLGFGAGFVTYVTQASIQTCANHNHMAVVLSIYLASYSIGTALGATVSGAIWTNLLPNQLLQRLDSDLATLAYGSPFTFIVTYTWDTPERQLVVEAYQYVQKILCTVGCCLCVLLIFFSCLLRNHKLIDEVAINDIEEKGQKLEDDRDFIIDPIKKLFKR